MSKISVMRTQIEINTHVYLPLSDYRIMFIYKENWRDDPIVRTYRCSAYSVNRILAYMQDHGFDIDARSLLYGSIYGSKWES